MQRRPVRRPIRRATRRRAKRRRPSRPPSGTLTLTLTLTLIRTLALTIQAAERDARNARYAQAQAEAVCAQMRQVQEANESSLAAQAESMQVIIKG